VLEEELAEVMFRHKVGEYSDAEMADKRRVLDARLDSARTRISEQRRTLEMFDAMAAADAAPAAPVAHDDEPVASVRPAAPQTARAPERTPAPSLRDVPQDDEHARRPVLRPRTPDTPPAPAPAERVLPKVTPRAEAKAPESVFENPHDWIKEMGRETVAPRRANPAPSPTPTPTPARPRLGPTPARPAAAPSGKTATRTPSLVFVNGPHAGESVPLLPTTLTIGREHDNNIELKDPDVARYHARIVHERGHYVVEDLDSTTGTWVNGQRTKKAPLNNGDVVRVGSTEIAIDFEWASDPV
jgi:hypothetical protein